MMSGGGGTLMGMNEGEEAEEMRMMMGMEVRGEGRDEKRKGNIAGTGGGGDGSGTGDDGPAMSGRDRPEHAGHADDVGGDGRKWQKGAGSGMVSMRRMIHEEEMHTICYIRRVIGSYTLSLLFPFSSTA